RSRGREAAAAGKTLLPSLSNQEHGSPRHSRDDAAGNDARRHGCCGESRRRALPRSKGQTILLPLTDREIPVVFDEYVDPEFGTGVVKITPAHDPNDYELGLRHDLAQVIVIDPQAR